MNSRITPEGQALGKISAKLEVIGAGILFTHGLQSVKAPSFKEAMCKSCACIPGTVPNGCLQTQMDLIKAAHEGTPFLCHAPKNGQFCTGWLHMRAACAAMPLPEDVRKILNEWDYSPPDETTPA